MFLDSLPEDVELQAIIENNLLWQAVTTYYVKGSLGGFVSAESPFPFNGFMVGNRCYLPVVDVYYGEAIDPLFTPLFLSEYGDVIITIALSHGTTLEDIKSKSLEGQSYNDITFTINI